MCVKWSRPSSSAPLSPTPGVQEVEGVVPSEVGGLYPELWPDLWRTLRTAVMVQLLHRQLVTTSFGDASALLAVPERTSSLSPHQTTFQISSVGLDSDKSLWYLEGKCQKSSYSQFHVDNQGYSHNERQAFQVRGRSICWDLLFLIYRWFGTRYQEKFFNRHSFLNDEIW